MVKLLVENTANYYEDCKSFYSDVEKAYSIDGFFNRWKQHVELDLEYGHFEHFESIFVDSEIISKDFFLNALNQAWITYKHLYYSLDQIIDESKKSNDILLRQPIKNGNVTKGKTSLLFAYDNLFEIKFDSLQTRLTLFEEINKKGGFEKVKLSSIFLTGNDKIFFWYDIRNLFIKTLGYSKSHYTTIILGDLIKKNDFSLLEKNLQCCSPALMAVSNFFNELTYKPDAFIFVLRCIEESPLKSFTDLSFDTTSILDKYLNRDYLTCVSQMDELINYVLQLNELILTISTNLEAFIAENELN